MTARFVDLGGYALRVNEWMGRFPYPKQATALWLCGQGHDVLYGGAAGGGKTDCLLMAALQYADVPGYNAAIMRRTYKQLEGADGVITRSHEWGLREKGAHWHDVKKVWTFPSGAKLIFSYLDHEKHKDNWQGHEFQFVGRDEVTQWGSEELCSYPFTRLRRNKTLGEVPLRRLTTGNPGGAGHAWVKRRYLDHPPPEARFVPAKVSDNYAMDAGEYLAQLREQGELVYRRLGEGDWDAEQGEILQRAWFEGKILQPREVPRSVRWVHAIDPAASAKARADETASGFVGVDEEGNLYLDDIQGWRAEWPESRRKIKARILARPEPVGFEAVAGFKIAASDLQSDPDLMHVQIRAIQATADKVARTLPFASRAEQGRVYLVDGAWVSAWLDQALGFPAARHDDRLDCAVLGMHMLAQGAGDLRAPTPKQRRRLIL